eukprot:TRINITY_DN11971_c0_g1_i1.p1 TRINITY_DN11971_c0_g1~~TRINITY_DN11971_c0_g1_i1.p1  ORF type:complete len:470 (+),score=77.80 TRINITY_DN11971_c0_g1_i1:41-1411(+)
MKPLFVVFALCACFCCFCNAADDIDNMINYVMNGQGKGLVWNKLADFVDTIGPRIAGSDRMDAAIAYMKNQLTQDGFTNVHGENATVPHWVRGEEKLIMHSPRYHPMSLLGMGLTVGSNGNITAEAIVVTDFDDLKAKAAQGLTQGKIVVYNPKCDWKKEPIDCYGKLIDYRYKASSEASRVGAVASLSRSLAAFSIYSPHTGNQRYQEDIKPIPCATIPVEEAELLERIQKRGQKILLSLVMNDKNMPEVVQENVIAELKGSEHPEQVILIGGHLDSWDVGQGAMDDGAGVYISWAAMYYMKKLNIKPKRTIRLTCWLAEEFGSPGAKQYFTDHKNELKNIDMVIESDMGVFEPQGILFTGSDAALAQMKKISERLNVLNASEVAIGAELPDAGVFTQAGIPGFSLKTQNDHYFWFHHSNGDSMTMLDPNHLDIGALTFAIYTLSVANLDDMLPR